MNTKKITSINWWSDDARMSPLNNPENGGNGFGRQSSGQNSNGNPNNQQVAGNCQGQYNPDGPKNGQLPPVFQPLVVVPYSTTMQPLNGTLKSGAGKNGEGEYFEDLYGEEEVAPSTDISKKYKGITLDLLRQDGIYIEKRSGALATIVIASFLVLLLLLLGCFVGALKESLCLYKIDNSGIITSIVTIDPVVSFLQNVCKVNVGDMAHSFAPYIVVGSKDGLVAVVSVALPVGIVLYFILGIASIIAAIAGLRGQIGPRGYKKIKLGVVSIIMFGCALVIAIGGYGLMGGKLAGAMSYLKGGRLTIGIGSILLLALPVIIFICSCLGYVKNKVTEPNLLDIAENEEV